MRPVLLLSACLALACAEPVKVVRGTPPATSAAPQSSASDADAFRKQKPEPGKPGVLRFPAPEVFTLANGMTVYVVDRPTPVVTLSLAVRHGASAVPAGKSGLAALTARMLTEGTKRKNGLALAEAVEGLGTTLSSDAGRDESSVGLNALASDVDRALSLLSEVVREPAFAPADFERVRAEWLDGLASERQNPQRLASLAALRLLNGPVHGAPVSGSVPDIQRLKVADLRDFHQRAYVPQNSALIVVGKVDRAALRRSIDQHFGSFKGAAPSGALPFEPPRAPAELRIVLVDRPESVQSALFAVQPFPKRSEPGYETRQVLGRVVGGLFTSRINTNLREEHAFTYGAFAEPIATERWGAFFVSTSVRTDVTAQALREIVNELSKAKDPGLGKPIEPAEVARARADLVQSLGATLEHGSRVAAAVTSLFTDRLPADYYQRYPDILAEIDAVAVARSGQQLTPDRLIAVVVGDRRQVEPELVRLGFKVELADAKLLE